MPPIAKPVVTANLIYDCDGRARAELTTDKANYSYKTANTPGTLPTTPPSGAFTAGSIPAVDFPVLTSNDSQTVRVFYKETANPNPIILLKEDFGEGGITCGGPEVPSFWVCAQQTDALNFNYGYTVTPYTTRATWATWRYPYDHTTYMRTGSYDPNSTGRAISFNGDGNGEQLMYRKVVNDVTPNQPIKYKMYIYNLCYWGCPVHPNVSIRLV